MSLDDLLLAYQREVEDGLELAKIKYIQAGEWAGALECLKLASSHLALMEQEARSGRHAARKDTALACIKSLRKELDDLISQARRRILLNRQASQEALDELERIQEKESDPEIGEDVKLLQQSGSNLLFVRKQLAEMTDTGLSTMDELNTQNTKLGSIHGKVDSTNGSLVDARNSVRKMEHMRRISSMCGYAAIFAVFGGAIFCIYWVLFRVDSSSPS